MSGYFWYFPSCITYFSKSIKDVLSETEEVRKYLAEDGMPDEKKIFSEMLADLVREQFGAQLCKMSGIDFEKYVIHDGKYQK